VADQRDQETRDRLLTAATRLFAEQGFGKVTVRDICQRANANVAAVNYHFGGKVGLYREVMQSAIRIMQATTALAREAGASGTPQERLTAYVQVFITRIAGGHSSWIHQLMMHEISDPTPALDLVVDEVIKPRMDYLGQIVAELLHTSGDDPRVALCAMSVHSQCMAMMNSRVGERMNPALRITPERLRTVAEHITAFSLAGITAARAESA
jgi:TetR/AcrR family transcriptional regulator, regulator of cefoperazone and chloramphenicol sensitivity